MTGKTRKRLFVSLIISFVCVTIVFAIERVGGLSFLEQKTFDMRVQYRDGQKAGHEDIVIVLIDEASLESMNPLVGRWPWPRTLYAELNLFLAEQDVKAVLYDVLFTEPQIPRDENGELGPDDIDLVISSMEMGHAIHAMQLLKEPEWDEKNNILGRQLPELFVERFSLNATGSSQLFESGNNNYYLPLTELYENTAGIGVVEFLPDNDGIFRRTKLIRTYQGHMFPVLSLAALIHQQPENEISIADDAINWGQTPIPLLKNGDFLVNPKNEFQTISIGGVFATIQQINEGNFENVIVDPELFRGKIVLVGASAVGVEDLKPTPYGPNFPGVFLHASIISNVLDKDFITKPPVLAEIVISLLIAFLIAWIITSDVKIWFKGTIPLIITCLYILAAYYIFSSFRVWLAVVFPVVGGMLSVYGASFIYMAFTEGTERLKTKRMFSQYLSPSVLSEVMELKSLTAEIGETKHLTILFSDIRGFTSISESLESRKVVEMLNYYLHEMVELVFKYKGTLDKFIGDAVMAFWGAPIEMKNHASQSVSCALEMIDKLKSVNKHFRANGYPEINIGVGLNTGPVIVGNIGSTKRLDYTVIGDNVNLASRIEGLTKKYGCSIIIAQSAHDMLDDRYICRTIDKVQVKGKTEPALLYEPLTNPETQTDERKIAENIAQLTDTGFNAYLGKDWESAENAYQQVLNINKNDPVADIFLKRLQEFKLKPPPEGWDGCYVYTSK